MKFRWRWWRRTPDPRCKSVDSLLFGYRCELEAGHSGKHEATISTTTNERGVLVGRKWTTWETRGSSAG